MDGLLHRLGEKARRLKLLSVNIPAGLAGRPAEVIFDDYILGKRSLAFLWEKN